MPQSRVVAQSITLNVNNISVINAEHKVNFGSSASTYTIETLD